MIKRNGKEIGLHGATVSTPMRAKLRGRHGSRRRYTVVIGVAAGVLLSVAGVAWLGLKASIISGELNAASELIPSLKLDIAGDDPSGAISTTDQIRSHAAAARDAASDPLWSVAATLPAIGPNFRAVAEVARSADDVANLGLAPLAMVFSSLDWGTLLPHSAGTNLKPLEAASPKVSSAAHAVRLSAERLDHIDASTLLPEVAEPLERLRAQLEEVTGALDAAADAASIVPAMLGTEAPKSYLLMIQNNAETRASGGIPGALAVLNVDQGTLTLGPQTSAGEIGMMSPTVPVDAAQQQIYSERLGKYMQDVNLTPDFPTTASIAQAMWERKTGQRVDGLISIDPVALSYILDASGPVEIPSELASQSNGGLPKELNGNNVVRTLLSDVYSEIVEPHLQDAYFAGAAQEIFLALSSGESDPKSMVGSIIRGAHEGRILVWSNRHSEQSIISNYSISGSVAGPSVLPAQFGVYFNDGTGAKMDYYMKRTVQLVKECARDGYEQITVRVTSTNTASADAATSLPAYVTGDGNFGVPAGSVQTNILAYGPVQANVETAKIDGQKTSFAPYLHSHRPVGVLAIRLAPGESRTVDFMFGKIVQHTEPNLVVTPTVQDVKDVILPMEDARCAS